MAERQDLVVVGGGAGGFAAAMRAAQLGGKVTVVESGHYGGNCMNNACIPLTFLATAAQMLARARQARRFGLEMGEPRADMVVLHERKDLIVEGLRLGTEQQMASYGITLVEGRGKLLAPDRVGITSLEGGGEPFEIETRNVVLATGSVGTQLPIEGADLPGVIGTEEAIELREVPGRLVIIGSQPWDLELAQVYRGLGSEVTLVEEGNHLLAGADRDAAGRIGRALHDAGITVKVRTGVDAIRQANDGGLAVVLAGGKGEVLADTVLAVRRLPNSSGLGLRQVGVKMDGAAVRVDERMATNVSGVYAIGDLAAGEFWSHQANAEGLVAGENALGGNRRMRYDIVPRGTYTWPQVAWVGLTEEEAEAQGLSYRVGKVPTAVNPHAMILDQTAGQMKVIAGEKYGKILGAHLVAPAALDLINTVAVAMLAEATVEELMEFVPRHPSLGEALVDAAMDVDHRSIHMPQW
jgi:dihydrolipoamide dehydrogenase